MLLTMVNRFSISDFATKDDLYIRFKIENDSGPGRFVSREFFYFFIESTFLNFTFYRNLFKFFDGEFTDKTRSTIDREHNDSKNEHK